MAREAGPGTPSTLLVIVTRRIGDVLLATPLIRSVKRAWPTVNVDVLVFEGTQSVLAANPDVRRVLTIPERPGFGQHLRFLLALFRRYDVALSALPGDRPTLYAFFAGRWRAGVLAPTRKERWKRALLQRWMPFDARDTHTVLNYLALAEPLGIAPQCEVVATWNEEDAARVAALTRSAQQAPIAVLHPYPKFNYKMWHRGGWIEVAHWLSAHGHRIALTGGPDAAELDYVAELARELPPGTLNLAGKLSLGGVACLLSRARVFLGPDTAVTHIAAAVAVPTVTFYGPTDIVKWGPWPRGHTAATNPWRRLGSQRNGTVHVIQGAAACAPCGKEGCGRNIRSFSDCLLALPAARVIAAIRDVAGIGKEGPVNSEQ